MGKLVKVKVISKPNSPSFRRAMKDMTVGKSYEAYMPSAGEIDKDGMKVEFDDECWIEADDAGDKVVTRLHPHLIVESEQVA